MSQQRLTSEEIEFLKDTLNLDYRIASIRLREGEYQFNLAKTISSFQLELYLPHVKDLVERLFGKERTEEIKFIRKIQTILKKMEKGNVVKILPRGKSWGLQRYLLTSLKFQDVEKNLVTFATDKQIKQMQTLLHDISTQQVKRSTETNNAKFQVVILSIILIFSYSTILWNFLQPFVNSIIFLISFSISTICSLMLGKILSEGQI